MTQATQTAYDAIDLLVEETMAQPPQIFPYTVRQLAKKYGIGFTTVYRHLDNNKYLYRSGKRWFYRQNPERHE
jgi:DNA invertase Pin-like site-specific DNA recombinase